jgi:hypothetical protein
VKVLWTMDFFVHIAKVPYALYSDTRSLVAFGHVVVEISRGECLCRSGSGWLPGRLAST